MTEYEKFLEGKIEVAPISGFELPKERMVAWFGTEPEDDYDREDE